MPSPQVVAIGHAIVDVLSSVPDSLVADLGLEKGTMTLVPSASSLVEALDATTMVSGGSAANTAVGLAALGTPAAFVGKVAADDLGRVFASDIQAAGVAFDVPVGDPEPGTGTSVVLVTPDAEKTMCTSLGIGDLLAPADLTPAVIEAAEVVYLEGYLCGVPSTDPTVDAAIAAARAAGTTVALSLSDPFWVSLHRERLWALLDDVDLLFGNEDEALGMVPSATTLTDAVDALAAKVATVVITRGAAGAVVSSGGSVVSVPAAPVAAVVDTTGAGDLFAAGYLHGVVSGFDPARCATLGGLCSAEVITHLGARPQVPLAGLLDSLG